MITLDELEDTTQLLAKSDEDEFEEDCEEVSCEALELLYECMATLGFLSNTELTPEILDLDRKEMRGLAERIREYLVEEEVIEGELEDA